MIKQHKNYIFVDGLIDYNNGVLGDCSDGYLKSIDGITRVKLPHKNYEILGIVDECLTAPYAEEFSKEIVDYYSGNGEGYGGYCNYIVDAWVYHLQTAVESMRTLIEKLDLKPTDYILRDEN
jgi:hypothetical protein